MKTRSLWHLAITVLGLAAFSAASTITFISGNGTPVTGQTTPPGHQVLYYPYVINVDQSVITVACDDFADDVGGGETWTATINHFTFDASNNVTGVTGGLFSGSGAPVNYEEAAYLFYNLQPTPPDSNEVNAAINYAIWDLFDSSAPSLNAVNGDQTTSSAYWLSQAESNYSSLTYGQLSQFNIYTPTSWAQDSSRPQEFIGSAVPEPASLALLGTGLLGLAFLFKRRLHEGVNLDMQA